MCYITEYKSQVVVVFRRIASYIIFYLLPNKSN